MPPVPVRNRVVRLRRTATLNPVSTGPTALRCVDESTFARYPQGHPQVVNRLQMFGYD